MTDLIKIKPLVDIKIIEETLSRIGIADRLNKILYPSCYLYKDATNYYIVHFKQLFELTRYNSYNNISSEDLVRRNAIIFNLRNWKLIEIVDDLSIIEPFNKFVFVLSFKDKYESGWQIKHKFNIITLNNINKNQDKEHV